MRVLVTGATGFIGSHTAVALSRHGHQPRLLVRDPDKLARVMAAHNLHFTDIVKGDVTDAAAVRTALQGCDAVLHSAAFVSTDQRDRARVFATNVGGTRNVIGQAVELGLKRIVHVSSITAIYDPKAKYLTGDEQPSRSQSAYGQSKAECERLVRGWQADGNAVSISYPAAVIGPHDPALTEPHEGLLIFLRKVGVVTSSGIQMVDVRDVADAHVAMLEKAGMADRITLGGHYYRWRELMDELESLTGRFLPKALIPGPALRLLGKGGDLLMSVGASSSPLNTEAMQYATRWVPTDDRKFHQRLGLHYRDHRQTLRETLISLYQQGHLSRRQIGKLG